MQTADASFGQAKAEPTAIVSDPKTVEVSGNSHVIPTEPVKLSALVPVGKSKKAHAAAKSIAYKNLFGRVMKSSLGLILHGNRRHNDAERIWLGNHRQVALPI